MAAIAPYRPVEDFVDTYYILYVNTNKKNAKAHSSSHLISLWYQLIFCKDFKKTWKKKKQKTFFAKILYFTKYFRCFLQDFFGDEDFWGLYVDVLWTLFMFLLCEICSVVLFLSGLDLAYYVCIISSWEVFILKRHDISLTRNGADVFICWLDDCLLNITWNKQCLQDLVSSLVKKKNPLSFCFVTVGHLKVYMARSHKCLPIPQEPPTRPATQSFCRRNKPQLTEEQHILQFSLK